MDDYLSQQAKEIAKLLVRSTLIAKEKEMATAALLRESLRKRFGKEAKMYQYVLDHMFRIGHVTCITSVIVLLSSLGFDISMAKYPIIHWIYWPIVGTSIMMMVLGYRKEIERLNRR